MIGDDRQHLHGGARQFARFLPFAAEQVGEIAGGLEMPMPAALDQFDTGPGVARGDGGKR